MRINGPVPNVDLPPQFMQSVLNAVPDAVIGLDGRGSIRLISPAAANVFGHEDGTSATPELTSWLPDLDLETMERRTLEGLHLRARGVHVARFESMAHRQDGTPFPADITLTRTDAQDGLRYLCVVRDMTEQRMADAMLNLYMRALDCATNGVVICDMGLPGAPIFHVNPAFCVMTGYDEHEVIGRNLEMFARGDTDQQPLQQIRSAFLRGSTCSVVLRYYRKNGDLFFAEISVAPVRSADSAVTHFVCIVSDVTERERARMATAERSDRLQAVFELSPDGFVVFNAQRQLVYCNRAFLRMTGHIVAPEEAVDVHEFDARFARLTDPTHPASPIATVLNLGSNGGDTVTLSLPERRILRREWRRETSGNNESFVYLRDITRETEVDRMKSEFLTTAAHELRTPMVSVFGFTELLLNRTVSDARRREMLETIHRQSHLLISMVNDLLDLARIEARQGKDLKLRRCRLGDVIDRSVATFGTPEQTERMQLDVRHRECTLLVDEDKMIRALSNVLSNAFKYSPSGGRVSLVTLWGRMASDDAVGVQVSDRGIGMSSEQVQRVFERFYRADPSGNIPGTGLGMSLVKEIVELHGGRVDVNSELGHGTSVTLWWPLRHVTSGFAPLGSTP